MKIVHYNDRLNSEEHGEKQHLSKGGGPPRGSAAGGVFDRYCFFPCPSLKSITPQPDKNPAEDIFPFLYLLLDLKCNLKQS